MPPVLCPPRLFFYAAHALPIMTANSVTAATTSTPKPPQSAATPQLAFVAMNPFSLLPGYAPVLTAGELAELGVERSEELCFYALCVVRSPVGESTVNLRCPIAVNDRTGKAMQAILETGDYHMRHLLSEFGSGKGDGPC